MRPLREQLTISPTMQPEVASIVNTFKSWDEEGTGLISRSDLTLLIRTLTPGITDADISKLFDALAEEGMAVDDLKYEDFVAWLWASTEAQAGAATSSSAMPAAHQPEEVDEAIDEEARRRGLWEGSLAEAMRKASEKYAADKVCSYWGEVQARLVSEEYINHVQGEYFKRVDADHDGKISLNEVSEVIAKSLKCVADIMGTHQQPTMQEIRAAFDAHDTLATGRGVMGVDEFLNLMRYLQVRVAEAAMAMSRIFQLG